MCYLPPFGKRFEDLLSRDKAGLSQRAITDEMAKWTKKAEECYVEQMTLMLRFNEEVQRLRKVVTSQDDLIKHLMTEIRTLNRLNLDDTSNSLFEIDAQGHVVDRAGDRSSHSEELQVRVKALINAREVGASFFPFLFPFLLFHFLFFFRSSVLIRLSLTIRSYCKEGVLLEKSLRSVHQWLFISSPVDLSHNMIPWKMKKNLNNGYS